MSNLTGLEIAVIGMSGRFPEASNIEEFWENIRNGKESISFFTPEELEESGIDPQITGNPNYVPCKGGVLEGKEYFDAGFFKYSADEAELLSPQTRLLHESVWEAIEEAGYNVRGYNGAIGLYAGASSGFMWEALAKFSGANFSVNDFFASILSGREFLCTQTSYKLNLKGPSVNVQTACSTGLAAIHTASRALLTGECQMAVAGGVSATNSQQGYVFEEGMISSRDGHIRAFDKDASGVVNGEGVGVVVLKLLKRAIKDGDHIHAIIKGGFANNDGDEKVGYTAPGVGGQSKAILSALRLSQVEPESISYVETHGTATPLGDVTEVEALKLAFNTRKRNYCAIGSVKTNIGHLDAAAGMAGFLKTVMALKNKQLPPSLNFKSANPSVDFENSPFYVNTQLKEWKNHEFPLRAGVSAFGMGGTNVHIILEEYLEQDSERSEREDKLVLLSAKSPIALDSMTTRLLEALKNSESSNFADVAYTLQVGREGFNHRRRFICNSREEAIAILSDPNSRKIQTSRVIGNRKKLGFMFSGMGAQYHEMCKDLWLTESTFRTEVENCAAVILEKSGCDIRDILYGDKRDEAFYHEMDIGQYLVFAVEYAMARLLISWGIEPDCMIGYSFGEFVAACLSGVFSLEDAVALIHKRGQLIKELPEGSMMSVPLDTDAVQPFLNQHVFLAIDNGDSCVLSGQTEALDILEEAFKADRIMCVRMAASRAVHSAMMKPAGDALKKFMESISFNKPEIPYVSNVTGEWIKATDAVDPDYWVRHMCQTVEFSKGISTLLNQEQLVCIEIGPGSDISALVNRKLIEQDAKTRAINVVRPEANQISDTRYLMGRLGSLWSNGVGINWVQFYKEEQRKRVSLPTYPFERMRFWKLMDAYTSGALELSMPSSNKMENWVYTPVWKRTDKMVDRLDATRFSKEKIVLFSDAMGIGDQLIEVLCPELVIRVDNAPNFCILNQHHYGINPDSASDYERLFKELSKEGIVPDRIIHGWTLAEYQKSFGVNDIAAIQEKGYYSLLNIAQSITLLGIDGEIQLDVITNGLFEVIGNETLQPLKNTLLGASKVVSQETSNLHCRLIDLDLESDVLTGKLLSSVLALDPEKSQIALRKAHVWVPDFEQRKLVENELQVKSFREHGSYLITGGLGGIALEVSKHLAANYKAKLTLVSRSEFPEKSTWDNWLANHEANNRTSERILHLRAIEEMGGQVCIVRADISEKKGVQHAVEQAKLQFGEINGLIHAATIPDGALIAVRAKEMSENMFKAKLYGTILLDEVLASEGLDFTYYFSTLSAVLGGFGQVGYAGANAFLDAYAYYQVQQGKKALSINWDRWKGVGIARIGEEKHRELANSEMEGGMHVQQAIQCFERIIAEPTMIPQIAVSQTDLVEGFKQSFAMQEFIIDESGLGEEIEAEDRIQRPDLSSDYEKPQNEMEEQVAALWIAFFGIREIGVNDNFFELGGDSLKGMILLKRMKGVINVELRIKDLFANPTIRGIVNEVNDVRRLLETKERSSTITI